MVIYKQVNLNRDEILFYYLPTQIEKNILVTLNTFPTTNISSYPFVVFYIAQNDDAMQPA